MKLPLLLSFVLLLLPQSAPAGQAGDFTTSLPELYQPREDQVSNGTVIVSFYLPETALPGSLELRFLRPSGALVSRLVLAGSEESQGSHYFAFQKSDPANSPVVDSGEPIPDGVYTATLSYRDTLGNAPASDTSANVTIIEEAPVTSVLFARGGAVPGAGEAGSGIPAGAIWTSLGPPAIGDRGVIAFTASIAAPAGSMKVVYRRTRTAVPQIVAKKGDLAPDAQGSPTGDVFVSFKDPLLNNLGRIAFVAKIAGPTVTAANDTAIFTDAGLGQLRLLVREGNLAPDAGGARLGTFVSVAFSDQFRIEAAQTSLPREGVAFVAKLAGPGVTPANDRGLWMYHQSFSFEPEAAKLLREGDAVVVGGVKRTLKTFVSLKAQSGSPGQKRGFTGRGDSVSGKLPALLLFTDGTRAASLFDVWEFTREDAATTGEPVSSRPGSPLWKSFGAPIVNEIGNLALLASVAAAPGGTVESGAAIYTLERTFSEDGIETSEWRRQLTGGDTDGGGTGASFTAFQQPLYDAAGQLAGLAKVGGFGVQTENDRAIFSRGPAGTERVAATGDQAKGTAGVWTKFVSVALPDGLGALFVAKLRIGVGGVSAADDTGFWGVDSTGSLHLLLREGSSLDVDGAAKIVRSFAVLKATSGSPAQGSSYNRERTIVSRVTFTDGTTALARTTMP